MSLILKDKPELQNVKVGLYSRLNPSYDAILAAIGFENASDAIEQVCTQAIKNSNGFVGWELESITEYTEIFLEFTGVAGTTEAIRSLEADFIAAEDRFFEACSFDLLSEIIAKNDGLEGRERSKGGVVGAVEAFRLVTYLCIRKLKTLGLYNPS